MAANLNSAMFNSSILLRKKTSIFHSHSTWWWHPSWILPFWLHPFCTKNISLIYFDSTWWWQPSWIPPSWIWPWWIQPFCTNLWLRLIQSDSNLFILTQTDDGSHLEFCHVGLRHCHLGFRHLVIFSQIHSKTLSLHSDSDSNQFNLTQTHSFSPNLMMAAILNLAILNSAILVFPFKLTHTCQDWFSQFAQKKTSLIHSDSTWWWQPSWIWPWWIQPICTKLWLKLI